MKNNYTLLFFLLVFQLQAQITISDTDMPTPGDTVRKSIAANINAVDVSQTGANYTWDFSSLLPISQVVDTFLNPAATPLAYQVYFNNIFFYPNYRATVAHPVNAPNLAAFLQLDQVVDFYKNSTSSYIGLGFGTEINGLATSVKMDSVDYIYQFPLNYDDKDSSISKFKIIVQGLGYYGQRKKRINHVDGWGTLITPFGTFQTLRVKSELQVSDTTFSEFINNGTKSNRPVEYEYKWLGTLSKIPLLEVRTQMVNNSETITSVVYQDSARGNILDVNEEELTRFEVYPNPANDVVFIDCKINSNDFFDCVITDVLGNEVHKIKTNNNVQTSPLPIYLNNLSSGLYFVNLRSGKKNMATKLIIGPRN